MAFCVVGTCFFCPTTIIVTPRSRVCFPLANGTRQKWLHSSGPPFPAQSPIDPLWQQSQKICRAAYSNVPSTPGQRCARRSGSSSSPSSTCTSLIKAMAGAQSVHVDRPTDRPRLDGTHTLNVCSGMRTRIPMECSPRSFASPGIQSWAKITCGKFGAVEFGRATPSRGGGNGIARRFDDVESENGRARVRAHVIQNFSRLPRFRVREQ